MSKVLVDTDIILDLFLDRKPFSDDAAKLMALCESKVITGYITSVILSNTYYLLRLNANHDYVIEKLNQLISITEVLTTGKEAIKLALNSGFKDFEDALQNYSAEIHGEVEAIITRNIRDYKKSNLVVMTPSDFLKMKVE